MSNCTTNTALTILEWRLDSIDFYLDKDDEMELKDIVEICRNIVDKSDQEIYEEYLA